MAAGTEYDVLAVTGNNVEFDGNVNVNLSFEPSVNDEFIIATTIGIISSCNIANTTSADFNGNTYTFDVFCRNDNELVLGVNSITLGIDVNELNSSVSLYPNPVKNKLTLKNNGNIKLTNAVIVDVRGAVIQNIILDNMPPVKDIYLSHYTSGVYFINIETERGSIVKRFIKQ